MMMKFKEWLNEDITSIYSNEPSTPASADGNPPRIRRFRGSEDPSTGDTEEGEGQENPVEKQTSKPTAAFPVLTAKIRRSKK